MINRPCRPDPDLQWIWQTLLPDTPYPSCSPQKDKAAQKGNPAPNARAGEQVEADPQDERS
jgi:hypothetical protein